MLQQVIFVEKTKFIYKLVSSVLKTKQIGCYVVDNEEDFTFQIEDLRPEVIVVNLQSVDFDWVKRNIEAAKYKNFITVAIGKSEIEDDKVKNDFFDHFVKLPIQPYDLARQLKKWGEVH